MLTHDQIWVALDQLAARAGLSPSGLAKRAGLDPTTFNRSKRVTPDGRERWPSTESIAKALAAAGSSIATFALLIEDGASDRRTVPLLGLAAAGASSAFDETGRPSGKDWTEIALPIAEDGRMFGLKVTGDGLQPAYRDGDVILVSPDTPIRKGDRVVVKTRDGEMMVATLKRRTAKALDLQLLDASQAERTMPASDVGWIARIVWVRQ